MNYTLEELDIRRGALRLERYSVRDYRVEVLDPLIGRWITVSAFKTLPPARR